LGGVWAGITGPDDFHQNVNNNAFTLCAVSLAIHWARYYSCLCERNERDEVPDEYILKALYLNLPYDNIKRLHYAHEGFNPGRFFLTGSLKFAFTGWVKNHTFSFYMLLPSPYWQPQKQIYRRKGKNRKQAITTFPEHSQQHTLNRH